MSTEGWSAETLWAASVPGWTPYALGQSIYQSRYLSDSGRLFFNSPDALVVQDINNNQDVYEYEPVEIGNCSEGSVTYHPSERGCVGLISSGRASGESAFLDASETGNDVFFLTAERLTPQDVDSAIDVYDAHSCPGGLGCFANIERPPACTTADACRVAPVPQSEIFGSPASETFKGPGNVAPRKNNPCADAQRKTSQSPESMPGEVQALQEATRPMRTPGTRAIHRPLSKPRSFGASGESAVRMGAIADEVTHPR